MTLGKARAVFYGFSSGRNDCLREYYQVMLNSSLGVCLKHIHLSYLTRKSYMTQWVEVSGELTVRRRITRGV